MFCTLVFILEGCSKKKVSNIHDYYRWLNDRSNGLVKTKKVNGMEIKLKFMPPENMVNCELENLKAFTTQAKDSLLSLYSNSITFLMTLGPDEEKNHGQDVMYRSLATYSEYVERVIDMNFQMEDYIRLIADGKEYKPVLSSMDAAQGLGTKRNITFVFAPQDKNDMTLFTAKELDFKYDDEIFELGLNHFVFKTADIDARPEFTFWNTKEE